MIKTTKKHRILGLICIFILGFGTYVYSMSFLPDRIIEDGSYKIPSKAGSDLDLTFYSPDKKHLVKLQAQSDFFDDGSIIYNAYWGDVQDELNKLDDKILVDSYVNLNEKDYVVWLNSSQFLVNGKKVINTDGNINDLSALWGELNYVSAYKINPSKTKIALTGKDNDCNRIIKVIDINAAKVCFDKSYNYSAETGAEPLVNKVAWSNEEDLYFDMDSDISSNTCEIYKLTADDNLKTFMKDARLINSSPFGNYIGIISNLNNEPHAIVCSTNTDKNYAELGNFNNIIWVNEDRFIPTNKFSDTPDLMLYKVEDANLNKEESIGQYFKIECSLQKDEVPDGLMVSASFDNGNLFIESVVTDESNITKKIVTKFRITD